VLASRELPKALLRRGVPMRTRVGLLSLALRRRYRPAPVYHLRVGRVAVPVTHADYGVDWETMRTIVVDGAYELEYRSAVVVDIGAHKGAFGAYALERGARTVISYEPEETNYGYLETCAKAVPETAWRTHRAAVGATGGTAELHVTIASWGHALTPSDHSEDEVGVQVVPVVPMADVLAEASGLAGPDRVVVKVNAEGAECEIVLGTPAESWERAHAVLMEVHSWAPCTAAELVAHLSESGLRARPSRNVDWVHRLSR
jgi:FkbM family methyltransferase